MVLGVALLVACESGSGDAEARLSALRATVQERGLPAYIEGFSSFAEIRDVDFETSVPYYALRERSLPADAADAGSATDVSIVDYGPTGTLPASIRRPQIYVVFDQAIIPIRSVSDGVVPEHLLRIEPEIDGQLRALGSRMFVFEPGERLEGQNEYRVEIRPDAEADEPLGSFTFRDEALELVRVHAGSTRNRYWNDPMDIPPERARVFTLEFNYPASPQELREYITVLVGGAEAEFQLSPGEQPEWMDAERAAHYLQLELADTPEVETPVQIALEPGARTTSDSSVVSPQRSRFDFATVRPFRFETISTTSNRYPGGWEDEEGIVYLEFSHELQPDSIESRIWMNGSQWVDISDHAHVTGRVVRLSNLPATFEQSLELELREGITDRYARSIGDTRRVREILPPASSRFSMSEHGNRVMESAYPASIWFSYRNLVRAEFSLGSVEHPFLSPPRENFMPLDMTMARRNVPRLEVIDLRPYLGPSGTGSVELRWNAFLRARNERETGNRSGDLRVQVTDIGVTARWAQNRVLVWATSMSSGAPLVDAEVSVEGLYGSPVAFGRTNSAGFASIPLDARAFNEDFVREGGLQLYITVRTPEDRLVLSAPQSHSPYRAGVNNVTRPGDGYRPGPDVWMASDRGVYRPGEEIRVAGFDRLRNGNGFRPYHGPFELRVRHRPGAGDDLFHMSAETDRDGVFELAYTLPDDLNPGTYAVEYSRDGESAVAYFDVAFVRAADLSVTHEIPDHPFVAMDVLPVQTSSAYLAGGVPEGADTRLTITAEAHVYEPEAFVRSGYQFGPSEWTPAFSLDTRGGVLDDRGSVVHEVETPPSAQEGRAYRYTLQSTVVDASDRETAHRSSVLVHPADRYVGIRLADSRWFYAEGETVSGDVVVVRPTDSKPVNSGAVLDPSFNGEYELSVYRHEWRVNTNPGPAGAYWRTYERVTEMESSRPLRLRQGRAPFTVEPEHSGSYSIVIRGTDREGRHLVSTYDLYVTGADVGVWNFDFEGQIRLDPEKPTYAPGETATILVRSPLEAGRYLVTVEQSGILDEFFVELDGTTTSIEVPVREEHVPVVYVGIFAARPRSEEPPDDFGAPDLGRPSGFFGMTEVRVATESRRVDLEVDSSNVSVEPGDSVDISVYATRDGVPVEDLRVFLIGADRGILDLIDYRIPDPVDHMYRSEQFPLSVGGGDSRDMLISPVLFESRNLHGGGGGLKADSESARFASTEDAARVDFSRIAVFDLAGRTNWDGRAEFRVDLPDSLTTWRFTAVAAGADRFGIGEYEMQVGLPVNVRTDFPAALRVRDSAELGVLLTNTGETDISGSIRLTALNGPAEDRALSFHSPQTVQVELQGGETQRVPFMVSVHSEAEIRFRIDFESDVFNDSMETSLSAVAPSARETVSSSARLEPDVEIIDRVLFPMVSVPGSEELRLTVRTDRLSALDSAVARLSEPTAGLIERIVGQAHVLSVAGPHVEAESFDHATHATAFRSMAEFQRSDGGLAVQEQVQRSNPTASARVGIMYADMKHADPDRVERLATEAGFDEAAFRAYLEELFFDDTAHRVTRLTAGYALSILGVLETEDIGWIERQLGSDYGHAERSLLALAYLELGNRERSRSLYETMKEYVLVSERSAELRDDPRYPAYLDSPVATLARMFAASMIHETDEGYSGRLAETLELRWGRRLSSTDASWIVHAFARLGPASLDVPQQELLASIGDVQLGSAAIGGGAARMVEFQTVPDHLENVPAGSELPIRISGLVSPLWYRVQLSYLLPAETVGAFDQGISLVHQYRSIDGEPVDPERLVSGRTYRVRTLVSTGIRRSMVQITVPVPSGMDILDTQLETTGAHDPGELGWGDVFDSEYRILLEDLHPGAFVIEFLARATTPGVFPVPPADATLIYEPEVFGRSSGGLVQIFGSE
ncbi:MAG: alpha-2-macroglobulin family protein [bacterium]